MKRTICLVLAYFALSFTAVNAYALVDTIGSIACGDWVANKEKNKGNGWSSIVNHAWLMGFLSAYAVHSDKDILKDESGESLALWVDNYCHANPLKNSADAGMELFYELKKQKGLK